jgi:hypothetical protein
MSFDASLPESGLANAKLKRRLNTAPGPDHALRCELRPRWTLAAYGAWQLNFSKLAVGLNREMRDGSSATWQALLLRRPFSGSEFSEAPPVHIILYSLPFSSFDSVVRYFISMPWAQDLPTIL